MSTVPRRETRVNAPPFAARHRTRDRPAHSSTVGSRPLPACVAPSRKRYFPYSPPPSRSPRRSWVLPGSRSLQATARSPLPPVDVRVRDVLGNLAHVLEEVQREIDVQRASGVRLPEAQRAWCRSRIRSTTSGNASGASGTCGSFRGVPRWRRRGTDARVALWRACLAGRWLRLRRPDGRPGSRGPLPR